MCVFAHTRVSLSRQLSLIDSCRPSGLYSNPAPPRPPTTTTPPSYNLRAGLPPSLSPSIHPFLSCPGRVGRQRCPLVGQHTASHTDQRRGEGGGNGEGAGPGKEVRWRREETRRGFEIGRREGKHAEDHESGLRGRGSPPLESGGSASPPPHHHYPPSPPSVPTRRLNTIWNYSPSPAKTLQTPTRTI